MTTTYDANKPVWEFVRGNERRARVLEQFGIDYCCGGRTALGDACAERGLSVEEVVAALGECDAEIPPADDVNWAGQSMTRLADHIVARHHAYLRDILPRLARLLDRVVEQHADRHPNLRELRQVYAGLAAELSSHMLKEETVLFPFVRALEQAVQAGGPVPQFHCGSVRAPIHVMEEEHHSAAEALRRMRDLTFGYRVPQDACHAYQTLMAELAGLERDLHLHIHKENNLLFPRAAAAEAAAGATAGESSLSAR